MWAELEARGLRLKPARVALDRVVLARRRARHRDAVLPRAPAPAAARALADARGRGRQPRGVPADPAARGGHCAQHAWRLQPPRRLAEAVRQHAPALPRHVPARTPRASATCSTCGSTTRRRTRTRTSPRRSPSGSRRASPWRRRYADWPALREARVRGRADALAARGHAGGAHAAHGRAARRRSAARSREHYADKQAAYARWRPTVQDRDLQRLFAAEPGRRGEPAEPLRAAQPRARSAGSCRASRASRRSRSSACSTTSSPAARALDLRAIGQRAPPARGRRAAAHGAHRALPLQPQELGRPVKKPLRILVLMHPTLVPPDSLKGHTPEEINTWKTEFDVVSNLRKLGHEVRALGVQDELNPIRVAAEEWKPDVVFNLLEEFHGLSELRPARGRATSSCSSSPTPAAIRAGSCWRAARRSPRRSRPTTACACRRSSWCRAGASRAGRRACAFPLFVKSASEESSLGIAQASIVGLRRAARRARALHPRHRSAPTRWSRSTSRAASCTWARSATSACACCRRGSWISASLVETGEPIATARVKHSPELPEEAPDRHPPRRRASTPPSSGCSSAPRGASTACSSWTATRAWTTG